MKQVIIANNDHPNEIPILAKYCGSFLCRLRGLMFRKSLGNHEGLLMVQTKEDRIDSSIHMLFMNFDLTVIWIDSKYQVVDVKYCRKWKPVYFPISPARYVLETHKDRILDFKIGDHLKIQPCK